MFIPLCLIQVAVSNPRNYQEILKAKMNFSPRIGKNAKSSPDRVLAAMISWDMKRMPIRQIQSYATHIMSAKDVWDAFKAGNEELASRRAKRFLDNPDDQFVKIKNGCFPSAFPYPLPLRRGQRPRMRIGAILTKYEKLWDREIWGNAPTKPTVRKDLELLQARKFVESTGGPRPFYKVVRIPQSPLDWQSISRIDPGEIYRRFQRRKGRFFSLDRSRVLIFNPFDLMRLAKMKVRTLDEFIGSGARIAHDPFL